MGMSWNMNELVLIFEKEIIKNRWYLGRGRNNNIAWYNGENFVTISYKFNIPDDKIEGYLDWEDKIGCFQPFLILPTLEEILEENGGVVDKDKLIEEKWYFGEGNNNYVAWWSKGRFLTLGKGKRTGLRVWEKNGPRYLGKLRDGIVVKKEIYSEFNPLKVIDEGEISEPFGEEGWGNHYGRKLMV